MDYKHNRSVALSVLRNKELKNILAHYQTGIDNLCVRVKEKKIKT